MINEIGKSVLEMACREAVSGRCRRDLGERLPVQLGTKSFTAMVQSILKETGLPASRLELEVTESSLFSDSNMPITILKSSGHWVSKFPSMISERDIPRSHD